MKEAYKMEKNSIFYSSLYTIIHNWMQNHSSNNRYEFKVPASKIRQIDPLLKQKCIQYLILRKFSWIIKDAPIDALIMLNEQLKRHYEQLILMSFFKETCTFEILVIYLVKLMSHFLAETFSNILPDFALEAELSVILYYTFLGIEISQKTYEIISKKYILTKSLKTDTSNNQQPNPQEQKQFKTSKNVFLENQIKTSKKVTNLPRYSKVSNRLRYSRQSFCKMIRQSPQKQSLADFTTQLKQNLHVDPLPPLKRKKINVRELEKMNTEPTEQINHSFSPHRNIQDNLSYIVKKRHLFSNQLSNSIKTLHPQNLIFERNSKRIKLHQSFYDMNKEKTIEFPVKKEVVPQFNQKRQQIKLPYNRFSQRLNTDDWSNIIQDIKAKVIQLNEKTHCEQELKVKQDNPTIMQEPSISANQYQIKVVDTSNNTSKVQDSFHNKIVDKDEDEASIMLEFKKDNRNLTEYFSIHTYQESYEQKQNKLFQSKNNKRRHLTKNSIRLDKDTFNSSCFARKSEVMNIQKINLHADWIINHYKQ